MSSVPEHPPTIAPSRSSSSRVLSLFVGGIVLVLVAGYGVHRLHMFADPANSDPSPLPRVPRNAPFITTPVAVVNKMVELAKITDQDLVYDLGCGDGRLVITAAKLHGCRGVGFDIDAQRIAEAQKNAQEQGVDSLVTFEQQDIFKVDLREANVIVMYLLPWMLEKLIPQFEQCPPGTRLVSHDFWIEGVETDAVRELVDETGDTHYIRYYVTPLRKLPPKPKWKPKSSWWW